MADILRYMGVRWNRVMGTRQLPDVPVVDANSLSG
jgi:hypothetical protein